MVIKIENSKVGTFPAFTVSVTGSDVYDCILFKKVAVDIYAKALKERLNERIEDLT